MNNHGWGRFISPFHLCIQLLAAILFFFSDELDRVFNLYLLLVIVVGIPILAIEIIWLASIIRNLGQRNWTRLIPIAIAPVLVWSLFFALQRSGINDDWLRFQINKSSYEATVSAHPGTRYYSWDWGHTGGAGVANIFNKLVYDETDQVAHRKAGNGENVQVRSLGNHFYLITEID